MTTPRLAGENEFARDDLVRHIKGGGVYKIVTRAVLEKTMESVYVYRAEDGQTFVRPDSEMLDGRFSRLERAAQPPAQSPASAQTEQQVLIETLRTTFMLKPYLRDVVIATFGDSAASSQRAQTLALVEAGKACYEALILQRKLHAHDLRHPTDKLLDPQIDKLTVFTIADKALAAYTAALDAAGRGDTE
jgi:hypothetical protein